MKRPFEPGASAPGASSTPDTPMPVTQRVQLWATAHMARLTINPPLDVGTLAELAHLLDTWSAPPALKALVLDLTPCAAAGGESAGAKGLLDGRQGRVRERALIVAQERVLVGLQRIRAPILGVAAGTVPPLGCVLLSACELLLAAEDTCFVCEGGAGLAYRAAPTRSGATGTLTERISARQAYRQGLVSWLASSRELPAETERVLALLLEKSAAALALAKRAFLLGLAQSKEPEQALEKIGDLYLRELMATADALEGLNAFLEKRPPKWQEK